MKWGGDPDPHLLSASGLPPPPPLQPVLLVVVGLPPRGHAGAVRPPLALLMCLTIAPHPHHLALLALRYGYRPLGREWRGGGQSKDAAPGSSGAGVRVGHRCGATVWRIDPQTHQSPAQGALENPLLSPIKEHWGSSVLLTGGGRGAVLVLSEAAERPGRTGRSRLSVSTPHLTRLERKHDGPGDNPLSIN